MNSYAAGEQTHFGLCASRQFRLDDFHGDPRSEHAGIELFFSASDAPLVRVGAQRLRLAPDRLIAFNAQERHGVEAGDGTFCGLIVPPHAIDAVLGEEIGIAGGDLRFHDVEGVMPKAAGALLAAVFAARSLPDPDRLAFDGILTRLIVELLTARRHKDSTRIAAWATRRTFPAARARAKALVHDLAREPGLSLDDLARHAGLSKFHFLRSFKLATGATPANYRNRLRIEAAKRALRGGDQAVSAIAADVGFLDLSSFNKAFKRQTGVSATAYRVAAINS